MKFSPNGLVTGIGSLPYLKPEPALELIRGNMPIIPHWPQMPMLGAQEGFVFQFLNPLVEMGLLVQNERRSFFTTGAEDWAERLTEFYTAYFAAMEGDEEALCRFAFPRSSASGFYAFIEDMEKDRGEAAYLKGHLAGPLTVGFQLYDEEGKIAYYQDQLRDLLVKTLALHARWQAAALGKLGLPVMVFLDEPGIRILGRSDYITVTREMILEDIGAIFSGIHDGGAMAGVHSCDAIDWDILFESDLEVISFDAFTYFNSFLPYTSGLKKFLQRGGCLAWGIVPTSPRIWDESTESLVGLLSSQWLQLEAKGINREMLKKQALITPACGTGLLKVEEAEGIYSFSRQIGEQVRSF
ncbi:conserved hypothetical protein [Desulfofarcimen acetoxidans DSM 771]|uniref:Methionine synthase vitamin-B12 independent n=1 Tax=Desulfofarcimen acetoxidans (strain ATCC 49208 / DSM 771 / KCTC 5769 / VKM B-1644 / 5575) TaxID=485916 RepID=C8W455_DESAS|nr:hypothetical protein [Desulfofarcimen acetoxidans]ACV61923.1 conserved hypothetical protein [Desulfofarcimen acetoxidans DSM 771]